MASLQQIISWFKEGLFPSEDQFRQTWLSYWHKSEKIPQSQVFGLQETIESATQGLIYRPPVATSSALYTTYPDAKTGWAAIVEATGTIWQCEVQSDGTKVWTDTGLREFPTNVATQDDLEKVSSTVEKDIFFTDNIYVNKSSGAENTNNSFCATDFIEVSNIISITTAVYIYGNAGVCIYDENKALIKGYGSDFSVATKITLAIEIPIGAKYIRFSTTKAHKTDFFYDNNSFGSDIKNKIVATVNNVLSLNDDIANFQVFDNYAFDVKGKPSFLGAFAPAGIGYWTGSAGSPVTINPSANYRYMAFLPCTPGQKVKLSGFYTPQSRIGICVYADASGNYLGRKESGSDFATGKYDFVVPVNCTQLGIYFLTTGGSAWPIENATVQVGDFEATLNPDCLPTDFKDLTTIPPRVESLEEIDNFCYKTKRERIINFVSIGGGYWNGTVGEPVIVSSSATYLRNEIISVNYNDTITLRGVYSTTNTGCMAMIDADGNYLGRFNFNSANPDHDFVNGVFKFKVTNAACVAIGWYVNQTNPTEFPPANARLIINEGIGIELEITPEYKSVLENTLEISPDKEIDWIAQMFNRGKAIKTFTKKKCIIMWGQSNADGRNVIADAPLYIQDLGYILPKAFLKNSANGGFTAWNQTSSWAFKLITAYYLTEIDNKECYFINLTVGGTSMAETGTTTQHWTPFFDKLAEGDTSLLRNLENRILNAISLIGSEFDIRAVIGHQGEGDKDDISAALYYKNLRCFISYLRGVANNPYLPFVSGTIPHKSSSYNAVVEKAQLDVMAEDYYTHYVDLSEGTMFDGLHFDAVTSEAFGIAVYNKLKEYGL